jgi:diguanylate cyclase (GGDEF)-like protein/PAS domain S-box-containing protein
MAHSPNVNREPQPSADASAETDAPRETETSDETKTPHETETPHESDPSAVSSLVRALGIADRLIEELTAGEVDTVTDREGRSYLLHRAQKQLRQSEIERQTAILDVLPAHIVLLDADGVIVAANRAWREFGEKNSLSDSNHSIGRNYLSICDAARGEAADDAARIAAGIREVLSGVNRSYSCEYPCHSGSEMLWFLLTVSPVNQEHNSGAIVMHMDITARKRGEEELRHFAAAMDSTPDGIFLIDRASMTLIHVNEAGCRIHNKPRDQVGLKRPWEILGTTREELERVYDDLITSGGFADPIESLWVRPGMPPMWREIRRHAQRIGGRWVIVVVLRDITARKEAEQRIAYLNRVHAVLSGINSLIVRVRDRDALFTGACRIAVEQGGLAMALIVMVDRSTDKLVTVATAGMDEEFRNAIIRLHDAHPVGAGKSFTARAIRDRKVFVSDDSSSDWQSALASLRAERGNHAFAILPLIVADEAVGAIVLFNRERGFFHEEEMRLLTELAGDVAFAVQQIEKQERLDYLAYYDVLTGLANRHLFLERVEQQLRGALSAGHKLALCLVDLERFKNINDSLGRAAGDSLLRQVANWLISRSGDANGVARIDTDRFAIVIPEAHDEAQIARLVEKTTAEFLNHSFLLNDTAYRVAAKIGVAVFPHDGGDADTMFKHAEAALKKAKSAGDRYLFYAPQMTATVTGRLNLENQLRRALEMDEFVLHYQPKLIVANGKLAGAEALIRWNDPLTGLVPPGRFIPILEETGLIHDVGRWALNQAMKDYLQWRGAGLPAVRVAVNLSPLQLRHRDFIAEVRKIVGVDAHAAAGLELEITESLIMEDVSLSIASLTAVRGMGVRVAIDDFGTGFSSLSYLSKLPVDTLKIDRSFVVDMVTGPEGLSLVSIIINLAHSLKLGVVAEGVETDEQSRLLRLLDCDEIQGYLISKPLPAESFADKYLAGTAPFAK